MSIPVTDGSFPVFDGPMRTVKDWDQYPWDGKQIELQPAIGGDLPTGTIPNPDYDEEIGGPLSKGKDQLWKFIQNNPGLIGGLVGGGAGTWIGKKTGIPGGGFLGGLGGGAIGNKVGKWLFEKYGRPTPNNSDLRDTPTSFRM